MRLKIAFLTVAVSISCGSWAAAQYRPAPYGPRGSGPVIPGNPAPRPSPFPQPNNQPGGPNQPYNQPFNPNSPNNQTFVQNPAPHFPNGQPIPTQPHYPAVNDDVSQGAADPAERDLADNDAEDADEVVFDETAIGILAVVAVVVVAIAGFCIWHFQRRATPSLPEFPNATRSPLAGSVPPPLPPNATFGDSPLGPRPKT